MATEVDHAPDLHPGAHGAELAPWITYLQQLLERRGAYNGAIDGQFTPAVEAAVRHVQQQMAEYAHAHHEPAVAVDGVVRLPVWHELYSGASNKEAMDALPGIKASTHHVETDDDSDDGTRVDWTQIAGMPGSGGKLGPAREIGRHGWVHGSVQCSIVDFKGDAYNGPVYVVFQDGENQQSDESGYATNGLCTIGDIWLPAGGMLRLTIEGATNPEGAVGPVFGPIHHRYELPAGHPMLGLHVRQVDDPQQVSMSDAEAHGWVQGTTVHEGVGFKVELGIEASAEHSRDEHHEESNQHEHTVNRTITVHLATPHLEITTA